MTALTPLVVTPPTPLDPADPPGAGGEHLHVVAWDDPVVEAAGVDPRSAYVETFWLPVLGPAAILLLRGLADRLEDAPRGFDLGIEEAARSLGLGWPGGRRSPIQRAVLRCARHSIVRHLGPEVLAVRRRMPLLDERHVRQLPASLRRRHSRWEAERRAPALPDVRRRARALALDLAAVEPDRAGLERRLTRYGIHPALVHESAEWAWARHRQAAALGAATHPNP
jgi:hypothetical protein